LYIIIYFDFLLCASLFSGSLTGVGNIATNKVWSDLYW